MILNISPNDQWAINAKEAAEQGQPPQSNTQKAAAQDTPRPDVEPRLLSKLEPEYTDEARRAGVNALVLCSAVISSDGVPQNIEVTRGAGFGLDENATRRFEPATRQGVPVPETVHLAMSFRVFTPNHDNQTVRLEFNRAPGSTRPELVHGHVPENPKDSVQAELRLVFGVDPDGKPHDIRPQELLNRLGEQRGRGSGELAVPTSST